MKPRLFRTWAAFALLPLGWAGQARGCGLDWALPRNHFEGVTNQGNVSYWEKIGEVDCGDGLVLPLHINFNSHRDGGAPSPYLGEGWILPLLESKFVQEGEDRFNMIQPDGLNNLFLRAEPGGSVLNGSSGWKGEIKGDTITAWASCGWKLSFENGHITSMTTAKGRKFDWVYEGGKVSELREGSATRLKVEYGSDGKVQALALPGSGGGGRRILVAQDKKPRVQTVGGQNVVTGVDSSLSHLTLADGREQSFVFGTDEKLLPTLEIGGVGGETEKDAAKRTMSWDTQSKLAVRDGEWTYQITPSKTAGQNPAIGRMDARGRREYWLLEAAMGKETVETVDGIRYVRTRFVSGVLAGRDKKIEKITNGGSQVIYQAAYDDTGSLLRVFEDYSSGIPPEMRGAWDSFSQTHDGERVVVGPGGVKIVNHYSQGRPTSSTRGGDAFIYSNYGDRMRITKHGAVDQSYEYILRNNQLTISAEEPGKQQSTHTP